ncbi:hypothetical protein BWD09_05640 [Neisseria dentiae]|uniref:Uncharacterized protein n=1 Tax=Neisseria dentiae TaxID=194197 RepID=A0A1X3DC46_9NEIS|nr:hypothetical protein BWD09_05640 [Neisseria dentiae]
MRCKNIRHHTTQCPADKLFGRGANDASAACFRIMRFSRPGVCTGRGGNGGGFHYKPLHQNNHIFKYTFNLIK